MNPVKIRWALSGNEVDVAVPPELNVSEVATHLARQLTLSDDLELRLIQSGRQLRSDEVPGVAVHEMVDDRDLLVVVRPKPRLYMKESKSTEELASSMSPLYGLPHLGPLPDPSMKFTGWKFWDRTSILVPGRSILDIKDKDQISATIRELVTQLDDLVAQIPLRAGLIPGKAFVLMDIWEDRDIEESLHEALGLKDCFKMQFKDEILVQPADYEHVFAFPQNCREPCGRDNMGPLRQATSILRDFGEAYEMILSSDQVATAPVLWFARAMEMLGQPILGIIGAEHRGSFSDEEGQC
eukprot:gnl/MRDRNA2_/MRDRNA2_35876_c0_seq1.p1 gnl/MRDRNA2_/MRDRNA2_35876_c0~~gnl/MRDRNA2_/MRDRNA2_35876_c0_seq1.p1  ORF type:complete len:297 (-),score=54.40 gnl/MRDRNA2_/MRDRNA2_35876_c0_seq1:203-1093(-)